MRLLILAGTGAMAELGHVFLYNLHLIKAYKITSHTLLSSQEICCHNSISHNQTFAHYSGEKSNKKCNVKRKFKKRTQISMALSNSMIPVFGHINCSVLKICGSLNIKNHAIYGSRNGYKIVYPHVLSKA